MGRCSAFCVCILSAIASAAAEGSNQERTSMPAMPDDAAVDMETKVEGFLVAARATKLVQRRWWRRRSKGGLFKFSSRASVATVRSDQSGTSTLTTTGNAAVDPEMKVWDVFRGSGLVRSGLLWSVLVWTCLVWSVLVWFCQVWSGMVWSGLVWSSLVWSDLVWTGLVWSDLVWTSLVWSGLV